MSETRLEHITANLELLGKLYCRYIDEHPESVRTREYGPVKVVRGAKVKVLRTKVVKLPKSVLRKAVQAMSDTSDWIDKMKADAAEKVAARTAVTEHRPPAFVRMRGGKRECEK
jgi:hypothetical protein